MICVGLTGSLAAGKSTIAGMFMDRAIPVHDCDAAVHEMYGSGGEAVERIAEVFAGVLLREGGIDRVELARQVWGDEGARKRLEDLVHPLLAKARAVFLESCRRAGSDLVVLEVPLLYETGIEVEMDKVLVAVCSEAERKRRAFERVGMTEERFAAIMSAQMSDRQKRERADYVIDTEGSRLQMERRLDGIIEQLRGLER